MIHLQWGKTKSELKKTTKKWYKKNLREHPRLNLELPDTLLQNTHTRQHQDDPSIVPHGTASWQHQFSNCASPLHSCCLTST